MNSKQKIIEFMSIKVKRIEEKVGVLSEKYFNKKDEEAINKWSEERSDEIWNQLKVTIFGQSKVLEFI